MVRALLAATLALLILAAPASADLTLTRSSIGVDVVGDDGPSRIQIRDGDTSGGDTYAFSFYSETGEPIDLGDSGCVSDGGAGGGVENISCASNIAIFFLGGGDDSFGWYGDAVFTHLDALGINFGAGDDTNESGIKGISTILEGDAGDDDLAGHDGPSSRVDGGPGNDRIIGGGAQTGETLRGGDGNDAIQGLNGNDEIFGDAGADTLTGSAGGDTITGGPGQDNVEGDGVPNAFSGNDTLFLDDGERDAGVCGFGADSARVDQFDLLPLNDCESVTPPGLPGGGTPASGTIPRRGSAKVALAKAKKLSVRKRKLSIKITCPRSASGSCSGRVAFTLRFTERRKKRTVRAASVSFILSPGASRTVSRTLSKKLVRRLRKAKKRKLTVRASSRDNAGRSFTSTRTGALKLSR